MNQFPTAHYLRKLRRDRINEQPVSLTEEEEQIIKKLIQRAKDGYLTYDLEKKNLK